MGSILLSPFKSLRDTSFSSLIFVSSQRLPAASRCCCVLENWIQSLSSLDVTFPSPSLSIWSTSFLCKEEKKFRDECKLVNNSYRKKILRHNLCHFGLPFALCNIKCNTTKHQCFQGKEEAWFLSGEQKTRFFNNYLSYHFKERNRIYPGNPAFFRIRQCVD